ncbi:hypothetical protein STEG23_033844 [Scotinomys teguina]
METAPTGPLRPAAAAPAAAAGAVLQPGPAAASKNILKHIVPVQRFSLSEPGFAAGLQRSLTMGDKP